MHQQVLKFADIGSFVCVALLQRDVDLGSCLVRSHLYLSLFEKRVLFFNSSKNMIRASSVKMSAVLTILNLYKCNVFLLLYIYRLILISDLLLEVQKASQSLSLLPIEDCSTLKKYIFLCFAS